MNTKEKYFSNISNRERAIFEGAISMGALFHLLEFMKKLIMFQFLKEFL